MALPYNLHAGSLLFPRTMLQISLVPTGIAENPQLNVGWGKNQEMLSHKAPRQTTESVYKCVNSQNNQKHRGGSFLRTFYYALVRLRRKLTRRVGMEAIQFIKAH